MQPQQGYSINALGALSGAQLPESQYPTQPPRGRRGGSQIGVRPARHKSPSGLRNLTQILTFSEQKDRISVAGEKDGSHPSTSETNHPGGTG